MFGRSGSFGLKSPKEELAAPGILPAFPSCYNLINGNRCKYTVKPQEDTVLISGLSTIRKETSWRKSMAFSWISQTLVQTAWSVTVELTGTGGE